MTPNRDEDELIDRDIDVDRKAEKIGSHGPADTSGSRNILSSEKLREKFRQWLTNA